MNDIELYSKSIFENIKHNEIINYIDVLVDGKFKDELRNPKLKYCGSDNQRVIDIKKTLKNGKIILFDENKETVWKTEDLK